MAHPAGGARSSPKNRNKQKRWRSAAGVARIVVTLTGKHERGVRYGRAMRAAHASVRVKAQPPLLVQRLIARMAT